jgi:hypothetical protein
LEPTNKPLLEIIANDGIALAQKFDYPKQESFIRKILKKAL